MTDPPPKPKRIRVQSRVMFSEKIQIQNYNDQDTPNSLYKVTPGPILKYKSTHHFYCSCPEEKPTSKTTGTEAGTFSNLRRNQDITPAKAHYLAAIYKGIECPIHKVTQRVTKDKSEGVSDRHAIKSDTSKTSKNNQLPDHIKQSTPLMKLIHERQIAGSNQIKSDATLRTKGKTEETRWDNNTNPPASPHVNIKHFTPIKQTQRTFPGQSPNRQLNQGSEQRTDADRTVPGQSPPRTVTPLLVNKQQTEDAPAVTPTTKSLIPPETEVGVTVRTFPGQSPPPQTN